MNPDLSRGSWPKNGSASLKVLNRIKAKAERMRNWIDEIRFKGSRLNVARALSWNHRGSPFASVTEVPEQIRFEESLAD